MTSIRREYGRIVRTSYSIRCRKHKVDTYGHPWQYSEHVDVRHDLVSIGYRSQEYRRNSMESDCPIRIVD
jgi:hypothetical protein